MDQQWDGRTYYDRPQLKPAPFDKWLVGGYVFLAGLSGKAQLLSTVLDLTRGIAVQRDVRRGRLLALLAPSIGSILLIADLHTPKRFYNMFRIAKGTSPMSVGTWILTAFSGFSGITALGDYVARWRPVARITRVPAAAAGAGLGTYTASLLSATSTPLWAAAPKALAIRFAASSVATAAAALSLFSDRADVRRDMDAICLGALAVKLTATLAADETYARTGVDRALDSPDGRMETLGGTDLGTVLPIGLLGAAIMTGGRFRAVSCASAVAVLTGSLLMRVGMIGAGQVSASRPDISLRFTQPR